MVDSIMGYRTTIPKDFLSNFSVVPNKRNILVYL